MTIENIKWSAGGTVVSWLDVTNYLVQLNVVNCHVNGTLQAISFQSGGSMTMNMVDSDFINNSYDFNNTGPRGSVLGVTIIADYTFTWNVTNCTFIGNHGNENGGVASILSTPTDPTKMVLIFKDVVSDGNWAEVSGGFMYVQSSTLSNIDIRLDNFTMRNGQGIGSFLAYKHSNLFNLNIDNSQFDSNTDSLIDIEQMTEGGTITVNMQNSQFNHTSSTTDGSVLGLVGINNGSLVVSATDNTFAHNNQFGVGGVMSFQVGNNYTVTLTLQDNHFINNTATRGGAFFASIGESSVVTFICTTSVFDRELQSRVEQQGQ